MNNCTQKDFLPGIVFKIRGKINIPGDNENDITGYFRGQHDTRWKELFASFPGIQIKKLFCTLQPSETAALIEKARQMDAGYKDPELLSYFILSCTNEHMAHKALQALLGMEQIETAYLQGGIMSPPANAAGLVKKNFFQGPGHLNAAPEGIDGVYARRFAGGKGDGNIRFIDIEQGWILDHEALEAGTFPQTGINLEEFSDHGAAALGVVMGITPAVKSFVISQWRPDGTPNDADAVLCGVYLLGFGDILLLETQSFDPLQAAIVWPLEIQDAVFDIIRLATTLGVIVVEAAANGNLYRHTGKDLDGYSAKQKNILDPDSIDFRDSGAIIVAAATSDLQHARIDFSNYGKRVNCYAWGENVATAGNYPGSSGTAKNMYTPHFNGTSSASAIIAGAAIAIQGISEAKYNARLSPAQMRAVLGDEAFGTPSCRGKTRDKIGVMPDLRKIIDNYLHHSPVPGRSMAGNET